MKVGITFKADREDYDSWKEYAYQSRISFGELVRLALVHYTEKFKTPPTKTEMVLPALAPKLTEVLKQKKGGKCENRLPSGAFCKQCGKIHA